MPVWARLVLETAHQRAGLKTVCRGVFSVENYATSLRQLGFDVADLAQGGGATGSSTRSLHGGDVDAIAGRIQAHLDAGADNVALQPIGVTLEDSLAQLAAIRPSLPTHTRPCASRPGFRPRALKSFRNRE